jgi:hypothetical protein
MSDTPRTDAASVSREFIAREMNVYSHKFVLAGPMRDLERELALAEAEIERLREAAMGVLDAMEVVRTAKQSEGAGGGNWISRPATREHQVRMQKAYADMHKAEAVLMGVVK